MNDIFYYIGFIYLAHMLINAFRNYTPSSYKWYQQKTERLNQATSIDELMNRAQEITSRRSKLTRILSIMGGVLFIWCFMGYYLELPEKNLFLFNTMQIVLLFLLRIIPTAYQTLRMILYGKKLNIKDTFIVGAITDIIDFTCISLIMYLHFANPEFEF